MYFACVKSAGYNGEGLCHNHVCKPTVQTFCEYNMQLYLRFIAIINVTFPASTVL